MRFIGSAELWDIAGLQRLAQQQPNQLRDGALLTVGAECERAAFVFSETERHGCGERIRSTSADSFRRHRAPFPCHS